MFDAAVTYTEETEGRVEATLGAPSQVWDGRENKGQLIWLKLTSWGVDFVGGHQWCTIIWNSWVQNDNPVSFSILHTLRVRRDTLTVFSNSTLCTIPLLYLPPTSLHVPPSTLLTMNTVTHSQTSNN